LEVLVLVRLSASLIVASVLIVTLPPTAAAQTPRIVSGVVSAAGNAPVADATVVLKASGREDVTVRTDADGRFSIPNVPAGVHVVHVSRVGLSPVETVVTVDAATLPIPPLSIVLAEIVRERVNVVGDLAALTRAPGSTHLLGGAELQRVQTGTDDIHKMLRQVPGLNIQEEDGYGLRPNIGMRGTGTDRSSKITMMEDGVLIAPAPYSAPAAYYAPTPGRMEALEIRKGSSQIKSGPITTGGVLNYVSTSIPSDFRLRANVVGGGDNTRKVVASLGDTYRNAGWLIETFQFRTDGFKQLDGGGDTGVDVADYLAKLKFNTTPSATLYQEVEFKIGRTTQEGQETYLGLTDEDFASNPWRRYAGSQADTFESTHEQYQVRHLLARPTWDVTTVAYRNNFSRAWYKLENVMGAGLSAVLANPVAFPQQFAVLTGANSAANALVIRNNNRTYFGTGIQTTFGARWSTGGFRHAFEAGLRYHEDEEDRFQQDDAYQMVAGRMLLTRAGAPGSQTNQVVGAKALAGFMTDTITRGAWTLTPGVRLEFIDLRRTDYARTDPARSAPTGVFDTSVNVVIPGVGLAYRARPSVTLFGGVHKGFAPPAPGQPGDTRAEESLNYEGGVRLQGQRVSAEVAGFYNDYSNLLGRDTLSTGGSGVGDLYNGGSVSVHGVEASSLLRLVSSEGFSVPVRLTYTLTQAQFRNSFQSQYGPWGAVQTGFELPYVPRHQLFVAVDLEGRAWRARLDATALSRMRTVAGEGALVDARSTDATFAVGASAEYTLAPGAQLFANVQNLTNRAYVASRHPAGVRPGLPRLMMVGLKLELGR
jgi:Fe(3+) dicitrate transport protein